MLGVSIKPAEEAHFTSGLSSSVPLQGCTTWPRADVSSRKLSGHVPKSPIAHPTVDVVIPGKAKIFFETYLCSRRPIKNPLLSEFSK